MDMVRRSMTASEWPDLSSLTAYIHWCARTGGKLPAGIKARCVDIRKAGIGTYYIPPEVAAEYEALPTTEAVKAILAARGIGEWP
jgi:hypothetical protein